MRRLPGGRGAPLASQAMLAVVPVRDGVLPAGGGEAAAECGDRCILVGSGASTAAAGLAGTTWVAELGAFRPAAWSDALAAAIGDAAGPLHDRIVVLPASPDGRDLAPQLAAALDVPLLAGAVSVSAGAVVLARDGGLHMHSVTPPPAFVATLQPGVRGVEPGRPAGRVEPIELAVANRSIDAEVLEVLPADAATIDLAEAQRILGGGAGLDGAERFVQLAQLGLALGASVGATRVITDRGWIEHERQIGTTGVVVDPDLYVAFGISGAVQHTSGLGHPRHVISVNVEAHCPMMQMADLGIVSDANAVLEELHARLALALAAQVV